MLVNFEECAFSGNLCVCYCHYMRLLVLMTLLMLLYAHLVLLNVFLVSLHALVSANVLVSVIRAFSATKCVC